METKTGLERSELELLLSLLFEQIRIVPREEFEDGLEEARKYIGDQDSDDIPFLALAITLDADIWSDDNHFQKQDTVHIWKTHELLDQLNL